MKNGNYNKMGKIVKRKIARFWIFRRKASLSGDIRYSIFICVVIMLFITLLLKKLPADGEIFTNLRVGNNPAIPCQRQAGASTRADNTQSQESLLFSLPAAGILPAGLQVDNNQLIRAADNKKAPPEKAGGLALRKGAANRPPNFNNERRDWLDKLIEKIWQVEASGRLNPPDGDGGRATGPLQIHQCVLDDVNRQFRTKFCREDLRNPKTAKLVAGLYISMWMEKHKEEIAARIFNGGPRGWRKESTDKYWEKIQGVK